MNTTHDSLKIHSLYESQKVIFDYDVQSDELTALLIRHTRKYVYKLNELKARHDHFFAHPQKQQEIRQEMNVIVKKWQSAIRRLGLVPLDNFQTRVHTNKGDAIWKFPAQSLELIN